MTIKQKLITMEIKARLSTLWLFVLMNIIFRDIHDFFRTGVLEEMMTGVMNGTQITPELMLVAGILLEIPLAMIILSRILDRRFNRWTNIIAGILSIASILSNGVNDYDDIWFVAIAIGGLLYIIWYAWIWPAHEAESSTMQLSTSLN